MSEYEKRMKQWDIWRRKIAEGDTSSAPRDWFEGVIGQMDQFRTALETIAIGKGWAASVAQKSLDIAAGRFK